MAPKQLRGDEAVFAFSPNPDSHAIILQHYGNFADVYVAMAGKNMGNLGASEHEEFVFLYILYGEPHPNLLLGE